MTSYGMPQGFIYLVSVTGVTGIKETMESRVEGLVATLHGVTDKPVRMFFNQSHFEIVIVILRVMNDSGFMLSGLRWLWRVEARAGQANCRMGCRRRHLRKRSGPGLGRDRITGE